MTATQTQIRRDTAANLLASTPALAELGYDITNKRLVVGDGSTMGGTKIPNSLDAQNNTFSYILAGGTANALTVALAVSPGAYVAGLGIKFKASATNTTGVTINVNGLGTKNLYKFTAGTLGAVAAGDIVNGGIYDVMYDGTQFQLLTYQNSGIVTVRQGDLATSTGSVSRSDSSLTQGIFTLPGGEYGFYPQIRVVSSSGTVSVSQADGLSGATIGSTFLSRISMGFLTYGSGNTVHAQQRYITSSPPFDDERYGGPAQGFFFALVNAAGEIISHYAADVPPWAYNGPTRVRADHVCPMTGKKFRRVMKARSFEEIMDGAKAECEFEEITQAIKNADMELIPHPFGEVPAGCKVVLLDPTDDRIGRLIEYQNLNGSEDIMEQISRGFIGVNNEKVSRKSGKAFGGFQIHRLKYKYTGGR